MYEPDDVNRRLKAAEILRPSTAEDIQDESHSSFETVLLVNNMMRLLGELPADKADAMAKEAYQLIRKYDAVFDNESEAAT